jgi:16S rRNA (adenine1518-N6/adenine1519-N6)-dimethyltransferase
LPRPRKRFGQHFLQDAATISQILERIPIADRRPVVEIGPGRGALTTPLAERCSQLHLIEVDLDLADMLAKQYAENAAVTVHRGDALKFDYMGLSQKLGSKLTVIGNLPYNISTPLLIELLSQLDGIHEMVFMVQREIAARLTARPGNGNYGRLTVIVGRFCAINTLFEVGPRAFYPEPKVHSSVVRFSPRTIPLGPSVQQGLFERVVRDAFAQRRKTLRNALKRYRAESVFVTLGIDPQLRAERLSIEQFVELAAALED